uniref:Uncharacterized protein n=1 Tax=Panagrolaimus sp. JU765 TaxID=591449 RepID=A0AC34RJZ5_9BILA
MKVTILVLLLIVLSCETADIIVTKCKTHADCPKLKPVCAPEGRCIQCFTEKDCDPKECSQWAERECQAPSMYCKCNF